MAEVIASNNMTVVVGLGATGLSVARFLVSLGRPVVVADTRVDPPSLGRLALECPSVPVELGELQENTLCSASTIVVSPGLGLDHPALQAAMAAGVLVIGDIQLFADYARAPIVAITGSNGKSTVTTLVGDMARASGRKVAVGGNLGTPALDLIDDTIELYVVELSSFQLELVDRLGAQVATVLNISPDHMDRYPSLQDYHRAKHRIFTEARQVVINRDDALSHPLVPGGVKVWSFGLDRPDFKGFGLVEKDGQPWLAFEREALMPVAEMAMAGRHNTANALAALAIGHAVELPIEAMLATLRTFEGLPHRCQLVARKNGVEWIDDSKATNVGAAVAAIEGLAEDSANLILLAGGQGKGQHFDDLAKAAEGRVRLAILFGEDAGKIAELLQGVTDVLYATTLQAAVTAAAQSARPGDKVLLSPACASFDMFKGFEDRGTQFAAAVEGLS